MKDEKIKRLIMGQMVELDRYAVCDWCKKKRCEFDVFGYSQPCPKCRDTKKYQEYRKKKDIEYKNSFGQDDALKANKPAAVWEGKGRQVVVNHKGDIISNVPYKPRPTGRKDWGKF